MKRFSLVAGCVGVLFGMLIVYLQNPTLGVATRFGFESHAETTHEATEEDHAHEDGDGDHRAKRAGEAAGSEEHDHGSHSGENSKISIAQEQIENSKIEVKPAAAGSITKGLSLPGTIIPDRNRVSRVPSKVVGTVAELKKRLGDYVKAGEIIAILDSREVADAKSEYIAALVNFRLQDTLYQREKLLWEKRVSSEQRLLRSEATHREAQVRRDLARQKLSALGVDGETIEEVSEAGQTATGLERYEIKAPLSGRVVEQLVDVGTPMGSEGQAHELYAIADLSTVWIELIVSTQDLPQIKEGQHLTVEATGSDRKATGTIIFTSPLLNEQTRSARVIAELRNEDGAWRPGSFVTADVTVSETKADLVIPKCAIQTIGGDVRVFVRTSEGFEARPIKVGRDDGTSVEVLSGLKAGDPIATENTFLLKAELGKSEAEHVH